MAINPERYNIDPLRRAIPGQSLTEDAGAAPYTKPPLTASVREAMEAILEGMNDPMRKESLLRIMETDISVETIASSIVMKAFSDGMITPDMAELIKPVLVLNLLGMASDENLEGIRVFNEPMSMPVSYDSVLDIKAKLNEARGVDDEENMDTEDMDMSELEEMPNMPEEGFIQRRPSNEMMVEE